MLIKETLFILFCTTAGGAISAGYVAFITLLGVFQKLAEKIKAYKNSRTIENLIILGVTTGNLIYLFNLNLHPYGEWGLFIFVLIGGIFTGCLAGALAETLNVFPIISRRFSIRVYLPYVLIAAAFGKLAGSFIHLYLLR